MATFGYHLQIIGDPTDDIHYRIDHGVLHVTLRDNDYSSMTFTFRQPEQVDRFIERLIEARDDLRDVDAASTVVAF